VDPDLRVPLVLWDSQEIMVQQGQPETLDLLDQQDLRVRRDSAEHPAQMEIQVLLDPLVPLAHLDKEVVQA